MLSEEMLNPGLLPASEILDSELLDLEDCFLSRASGLTPLAGQLTFSEMGGACVEVV